jgi:hypothetical protein
MPTTMQVPRHPRLTQAASTVNSVFWVLALGVIAGYAFFAMFGAFAPDDVLPLTVVVAVLLVLWIGRAILTRRGMRRDPRIVNARERRGF